MYDANKMKIIKYEFSVVRKKYVRYKWAHFCVIKKSEHIEDCDD